MLSIFPSLLPFLWIWTCLASPYDCVSQFLVVNLLIYCLLLVLLLWLNLRVQLVPWLQSALSQTVLFLPYGSILFLDLSLWTFENFYLGVFQKWFPYFEFLIANSPICCVGTYFFTWVHLLRMNSASAVAVLCGGLCGWSGGSILLLNCLHSEIVASSRPFFILIYCPWMPATCREYDFRCLTHVGHQLGSQYLWQLLSHSHSPRQIGRFLPWSSSQCTEYFYLAFPRGAAVCDSQLHSGGSLLGLSTHRTWGQNPLLRALESQPKMLLAHLIIWWAVWIQLSLTPLTFSSLFLTLEDLSFLVWSLL